MGRKKSYEEIQELKSLINEYKEKVYVNNRIVGKQNKVWVEISNKFVGKMSPNAIYTALIKNYHSLWEDVSLEIKNTTSTPTKVLSSSELEIITPSLASQDAQIVYTVLFSQKEFALMKPEVQVYKRNDKDKPNQTDREYTILKKGTWTHMLYKYFYLITKLQCHIVFKRAKIYKIGNTYCTVDGYCKECTSVLKGCIEYEPMPNAPYVEMNFIFSGPFTTKHMSLKRRHLTGGLRKEAITAMVNENMSASLYRKLKAASTEFYGKGPRDLPNLTALRAAKHQAKKKNLLHADPVKALFIASGKQAYNGIIRAIGLTPFFVYYWSNSQIAVYRNYCAKNYSTIAIDATGSVVRKLVKPCGNRSKHIFLYDVTVRDKHHKHQYTVSSMLSESNTALSIYSWLALWAASGAPCPNQVCCDMSLPLLYACVNAFTNFKTLNDYLNFAWRLLFESAECKEKCYIRCDVAHVIKSFTGWNCFKNTHKRTKVFYLKALGQLVQCTDIQDLENLLKAIFVVCLSDTEGCNKQGETTACEVMKTWLENRIGTGWKENVTVNFEAATVHKTHESVVPEDTNQLFSKWVISIIKKCKVLISSPNQIGIRGNQQVLPDFINDFMKISKIIPLWTGVMCRYYPGAPLIGSSAAVESNFNDIKHRIFSQTKLPIRLDQFVLFHINVIDGVMKLASNFNEEQPQNCQKQEMIPPTSPSKICSLESNPLETKNVIWQGTKENVSSRCLDVVGCNIVTSGSREIENGDTYASTSIKTRGDHLPEKASNSVSCPSCELQIPPNSGQLCVLCGMTIHQSETCFVAWDNRIVCTPCGSLDANEKTKRAESRSIENWRGLADIPVKRKRSSYLEPNSEFLCMNWSDMRKVIPIGLLKNGHRVDLKPIKHNEKFVTLSNTCGFDTITQILCSAYCDSLEFKEFVRGSIENSLLYSLVENIISKGINVRAYKTRVEILCNIFKGKKYPQNIDVIDAVCEIDDMLGKLSLNSIEHVFKCTKCKYSKIEVQAFLPVNIVNNISNLHDDVNNEIANATTTNKKCTSRVNGRLCSNYIKKNITISNSYVFVQPVCPKNRRLDISCQLKDIPNRITCCTVNYILRGAIGYIGTVDGSGIGHFVAYCKRLNNLWEEYNDLKNKKENIVAAKEVRIVMILYTT